MRVIVISIMIVISIEVTHGTQVAQILQKYDEPNEFIVNKTGYVSSRLLPIRQVPDDNSCT